MITGWSGRILGLLVVAAFVPGAERADAMILTKGTFKIVEVSPWKIEIVDGLKGHEEQTGLPFVTPDKWICRGAAPKEADRGKVFEFEGYIPDMGGQYGFATKDEHFHFTSMWSMPPPESGADGIKRDGLIRKLVGVNSLALLAVFVVIVAVVIVRRGGNNAGS